MTLRVGFLVCHLSGTGHLVRTLALARAVAAAGGAPVVISGGRPLGHLAPPGVDFVQLQPLGVVDFDYAHPRTPGGGLPDAAYLAARRGAMLAALGGAAVLVTELYPFGRRALAAEFEAALDAVPRAVCSLRDVPEPPSKPARIAEAAARLARYALVLVHGEPGVIGLAATWPLPPDAAALVRHTGYVAEPPPQAGPPGGTVLVSVGGGVLGRRLLAVAAEAAALSPWPWHLLVGGADAAEVAAGLARPGLVVEAARPDYRRLLAQALVSVSLAGYNTVMDLAACDTPAILVPAAEAGQREQGIRAAALARFAGITVLADPTPRALAAAVAGAVGRRRPPLPIARDGAARAARAILEVA